MGGSEMVVVANKWHLQFTMLENNICWVTQTRSHAYFDRWYCVATTSILQESEL